MTPKTVAVQVKVADLPQAKIALEAAHDALTLASADGWDRFSVETRASIDRALRALEEIGAYA